MIRFFLLCLALAAGVRGLRVVGYQDAERFLKTLERAASN